MTHAIRQLLFRAFRFFSRGYAAFGQAAGHETVWRNPDLLKLVAADVISEFGSQVTYFALLKKVYEGSGGNVVDLGFLTIVQALPFILFGLFGGVVADRVARRRILMVTDIGNGLLTILFIFVDGMAWVYAITFLAFVLNAFRMPAQRAFEPNLVANDEIAALNSFRSFIGSTISIVGCLVAASIVVFSGLTASFLFDAATFFISATFIGMISQCRDQVQQNVRASSAATALRRFSNDITDGFQLIRVNTSLQLLLLLELAISLLYGTHGTLIYLYLRKILNLGAQTELVWGSISSGMGIGAVVGSIAIGTAMKQSPNRFKLFLLLMLFDSFVMALFSISSSVPVLLFVSLFHGIICAGPIIVLTTILQELVDNNNRGKVSAFIGIIDKPMLMLSILLGTYGCQLLTAKGTLMAFTLVQFATVLMILGSSLYRQASCRREENFSVDDIQLEKK